MSMLERAKKDGSKFLNPVPTQVGGLSIVWKVLPEYLKKKAEVEPARKLGPFTTDPAIFATTPASGLRITWFGHSSSLIELDGYRILIDPVWDERASPFSFAGPKRFFDPTIPLECLPPLDGILVSHDHYDHLGAGTIRKLATLPNTAGATWVTSLGVGKRLEGMGVRRDSIRELDWTTSTEVRGLKLTAWPSRHFSGRGVLDRMKTLWSSFVLEGPQHRVYFGADSGWWEGYSEIAAQYAGQRAGFDLTMLEIGAFHPLWSSIHLGPDNALRAYQALGGAERAGLFFPIHWGLFNLALHAWRQPIERLLEISETTPNTQLWIPNPGHPTEVESGVGFNSLWWRDVKAVANEKVGSRTEILTFGQ